MRQTLARTILWLLIYSLLLPPSVLTAQEQESSPPVKTATVPNLVGSAAPTAVNLLAAVGLLPSVKLGEPATDFESAYQVYQQSIPHGVEQRQGSVVEITVYAPPLPMVDEVIESSDNKPLTERLISVDARPILDESIQNYDFRTGLFSLEETDIRIPAGRDELVLKRYLAMDSFSENQFAGNWRTNWHNRVQFGEDFAVVNEGAGPRGYSAVNSGLLYRAADGTELEWRSGFVERRLRDGSREFYDGEGRLLSVELRPGSHVILKYDKDNRLDRVTGPYHAWLQFDYDSLNRIIRVEASNGAIANYTYGDSHGRTDPNKGVSASTTRYGYDPAGRLTSVGTAQHGTTEFKFDSKNRLISRSWADGTGERYEYNDARGVWKHINPEGQVTVISWRPDRRAVAIQGPQGATSVAKFDAQGRTIYASGPDGREASIAYDALGRTASVTGTQLGTVKFTYEKDSLKPIQEVKTDGQEIDYKYDEAGNLTAVANSLNPPDQTRMEYDENGQLFRATDQHGNTSTYHYSERGFLESVVDSANRKTEYLYDSLGNMTQVTDPLGRVSKFQYDELGRQIGETNASGAKTEYHYNERGLLARTIDPLGNSTSYEYDARGRLISETDPLQRVTKYKYTPDGKLSSLEAPGGLTTSYRYDASGNLIGTVSPEGLNKGYLYDVAGRLAATIFENGAAESYQYNADGKPVRVSRNDGGTENFEYDNNGRVLEVEQEDGTRKQFEYNERGQLSAAWENAEEKRYLHYDQLGRLSRISSGNATLVSYSYDQLGRKQEERYGTGRSVTYEYDDADQIVAIDDSVNGKTTISRNGSGQPEILIRDDAVMRLEYDANGNLIKQINPDGGQLEWIYDAASELVVKQDAIGQQVALKRDNAGRLAQVTHPNGATTIYEYELSDKPQKVTGPDGRSYELHFNEQGRVQSSVDPSGRVINYGYDKVGRLTSKEMSDGTVVQYGYDEKGRLVSVDDGKFPVHYLYDKFSRKRRISYPAINQQLDLTYDFEGRLHKQTVKNGETIKYQYNTFDQLKTISFGRRDFQLEYDDGERLSTIHYPNGVRGIFEHDQHGNVSKMVYLTKGLIPLFGRVHEYDGLSNLVKSTSLKGESVEYTYDSIGQLLSENRGDSQAQTSYTYLLGGNRDVMRRGEKQVQYEYDTADKLLKANDTEYRYDKNGNLIEKVSPDGTTAYHYDVFDQLIKVAQPDGTIVEYGYSPTNVRVWRSVNGVKTYFVSDGTHVVATLDNNQNITEQYVFGESVDNVLAAIDSNANAKFFLGDRLGSVRQVLDEAAEHLCSIDYDAFGNILSQSGDYKSPFSYTGREWDTEAGLYYYRARYYDPEIGRFLGVDPEGIDPEDPLSCNAFLYAINNPLKFTDPFGTDPRTGGFNFGGWEKMIGETQGIENKISKLRHEINTADIKARNMEMFRTSDPGKYQFLGGDEQRAFSTAQRDHLQRNLNQLRKVDPRPRFSSSSYVDQPGTSSTSGSTARGGTSGSSTRANSDYRPPANDTMATNNHSGGAPLRPTGRIDGWQPRGGTVTGVRPAPSVGSGASGLRGASTFSPSAGMTPMESAANTMRSAGRSLGRGFDRLANGARRVGDFAARHSGKLTAGYHGVMLARAVKNAHPEERPNAAGRYIFSAAMGQAAVTAVASISAATGGAATLPLVAALGVGLWGAMIGKIIYDKISPPGKYKEKEAAKPTLPVATPPHDESSHARPRPRPVPMSTARSAPVIPNPVDPAVSDKDGFIPQPNFGTDKKEEGDQPEEPEGPQEPEQPEEEKDDFDREAATAALNGNDSGSDDIEDYRDLAADLIMEILEKGPTLGDYDKAREIDRYATERERREAEARRRQQEIARIRAAQAARNRQIYINRQRNQQRVMNDLANGLAGLGAALDNYYGSQNNWGNEGHHHGPGGTDNNYWGGW
ncbi:RHS repeat-associated core domain-containing protein [Calycomorphotria hydatis]|uniref:Deoxyribonuclease RhsC n=1 Tax=Calycomorphotria hydatis TaxID=2528027 RepID=A0A517T980_9PLAN|nr:RHS repeat-associated core domain-containing protein [Calycomorphotria hydatis]QDT64909.1 Putative deoxyribonuclease RhsC [Calycomorphotria hydatis]